MAVCEACKQEMTDAVSCHEALFSFLRPAAGLLPEGVLVCRPIPYGGEQRYGPIPDPTDPCHDCRCPPGGFHHPGCDVEECPGCGLQAIGCGCTIYEGSFPALRRGVMKQRFELLRITMYTQQREGGLWSWMALRSNPGPGSAAQHGFATREEARAAGEASARRFRTPNIVTWGEGEDRCAGS